MNRKDRTGTVGIEIRSSMLNIHYVKKFFCCCMYVDLIDAELPHKACAINSAFRCTLYTIELVKVARHHVSLVLTTYGVLFFNLSSQRKSHCTDRVKIERLILRLCSRRESYLGYSSIYLFASYLPIVINCPNSVVTSDRKYCTSILPP